MLPDKVTFESPTLWNFKLIFVTFESTFKYKLCKCVTNNDKKIQTVATLSFQMSSNLLLVALSGNIKLYQYTTDRLGKRV